MAKIDFAFSEEGDLLLGSPKLNQEDQILYYFSNGSTSTEKFFNGEEGKTIRDMVYTTGRNAIRQIITNRLKTDSPDWYHHPSMGGNLSDLIGEPNTEETGILGANLITAALTYKGLFSPDRLVVRPVPINPEEIAFFITVDITDGEPFRLPLVFNLNHGLKEA